MDGEGHNQGLLAILEEMVLIAKRLEDYGFLLDFQHLEQTEKALGEMMDALRDNNPQVLPLLEPLGVITLLRARDFLRELAPSQVQRALRALRVALVELLPEPDHISFLVAAAQTRNSLLSLDSDHILNGLHGLDRLLRATRPPGGFGVVADRPEVVAALGRANVFLCLARAEGLVQGIMSTGSFDELRVLQGLSEMMISRLI